jgi:hypothetical protein
VPIGIATHPLGGSFLVVADYCSAVRHGIRVDSRLLLDPAIDIPDRLIS